MDKKTNSIGKNAAILGIAGIIVKILGAIYRIPVTAMITDVGLGYYQAAYPIYEIMLAISTAGLPVAVATMVSRDTALGEYKKSDKTMKISFILMSILGFVLAAIIFFGAKYLTELYKNPGAYYAMIALVPAMIFSPMLASLRGYYQGRQIMEPTAISQIIVQLFRLLSGLLFCYILLPYGYELAAGGASLGAGVGALIGLIYMGFVHFKNKRYIKEELMLDNSLEVNTKPIVKEMIKIALPISIGSAIVPLMDSIDVALVMNGLMDGGLSAAEANMRFAWLKGMASTLINLPQVIAVALGVSIIPIISGLIAKREKNKLEDRINLVIKVALLIAIPCMAGLFSMANPIIALIYPTTSDMAIEGTSIILKILSIAVVPLVLITVLTAVLQAMGKEKLPVINLLAGAIFKIIITVVLTRVPSINVYGAAIGSVVGYFITVILDILSIKKRVDIKIDKKILLIFISSIVMGAIAIYSYGFIAGFISAKIATLVAILIAAVFYFAILIFTKALTKRDIELLRRS
ncbi:MAG: polysaccharide biosynthesis protein [Ezakiella sp.]|nr:polysaccharide biosynthesis protein [Ezakiella sp.]